MDCPCENVDILLNEEVAREGLARLREVDPLRCWELSDVYCDAESQLCKNCKYYKQPLEKDCRKKVEENQHENLDNILNVLNNIS